MKIIDKDKEIFDLQCRVYELEGALRAVSRYLDDQEGIDLRTVQYQSIITKLTKYEIQLVLDKSKNE